MVLVPQLIKDINLNGADSPPSNLTEVDGTLFFTVDDGTNGVELWKSDGTSGGTSLVKNINPNGSSNPTELTALNRMLYFVADEGNGPELWQSDGTTTERIPVTSDSNGNPISGLTSISNLTVFNNTLFFAADDGAKGVELWQSDGTSAGTTLVKNISGGGNSNPKNFFEANGKLFFTASNRLWVTDGTDAGTIKVSNVKPFVDEQSNMVEFGGKLYFVANSGGRDLWVSDGTLAGTERVIDFTATDNNGNNVSIDVRHLTVFNGRLFFTTNADNDGDGIGDGKELWSTDGTAEGTKLFKEIRPGGPTSNASPRYLTVFNNKLFFRANDGDGNELWVSNGDPDDPNGTVKLKDINGNQASNPEDLVVVDGVLYFTATSAEGRELWQTDGTDVGTVRVSDINPGNGDSTPEELTNVGDQLFFTAEDGNDGRQLWTLTNECFLTGTWVLTDEGNVAVEDLHIGDRVQTAEGTFEAIKWIGYQTVAPADVGNSLRSHPIQIKAGALGQNLPNRDLYVSPDHALLFEGLLINAGALVNDVSILKTNPTGPFTYYHVELERHALLVAEGTYAESYLPQKEDRNCYDNGAEYEDLYPNDRKILLWPLDYPRISSYGTVPRYIRKKLMAIANELANAA